jgi:CheY-like chemotaxis protein
MNTASRLHDVAWCTRRLRVATSCAHNPMVAPESLQAARTPARPLVLIIDEEETARDLYGHWFFAHGFEVMCAVGIRGLSFALRWERPQLIVTELRARSHSASVDRPLAVRRDQSVYSSHRRDDVLRSMCIERGKGGRSYRRLAEARRLRRAPELGHRAMPVIH